MGSAGAVGIIVAALILSGLCQLGAQDSKSATANAVATGRDDFNSNCAHCHGEDAEAEDSFYNLPQLLSDKNDSFFFSTVTNGIAKVGMPAFKRVLKRQEMSNILAYLRSVEADEGLTEEGGPAK
jgi:mono/diheme cytochrome c family protein